MAIATSKERSGGYPVTVYMRWAPFSIASTANTMYLPLAFTYETSPDRRMVSKPTDNERRTNQSPVKSGLVAQIARNLSSVLTFNADELCDYKIAQKWHNHMHPAS